MFLVFFRSILGMESYMFKIGVIGTADIAKRKMIPAMMKASGVEYAGVAIAAREEWEQEYFEKDYAELYAKKQIKGQEFVNLFGGKLYESYRSLILDESVDAVYIPLPPALHYRWAKEALEHHKHVLCEKPMTTNAEDTRELIGMAKQQNLVLWENYAFLFHSQFQAIREMVEQKQVGDVRLISACFGFPFRGAGDFRYDAKMGGGALLDCGGYTIKAATELMGNEVEVKASSLTASEKFGVDICGNITLQDENGRVAQLAFGMDNAYRCQLSVWGQKGEIMANRIFTAPEEYEAQVTVSGEFAAEKKFADNQFYHSLQRFVDCARNGVPETHYRKLLQQAELIDKVRQG